MLLIPAPASAVSKLTTEPWVRGGLATKLDLSGGTMTGAINMSAQKITNLGAPTATTDATTKAYVDEIAAQSAGGLNGSSPGWVALNAASWSTPHWGSTWEVVSANGAIKVEGVGACLGNNSDNALSDLANFVSGTPNYTGFGKYCFCRVSRVNNERVVGAWSYYEIHTSYVDCFAHCATRCGYCVISGANHNCTRAQLFSAP